MSFVASAEKRRGRRAPKFFAVRTLAIIATTALAVLALPTSAFAAGVAPSAPAQATVAAGNGSISVGFVAPADGGSPITSYTATCTSSTGGALGSTLGAASPMVVGALTNAATYTCTVHATNVNGSSAESPASAAVVVGSPSAPAAPTLTHGDGLINVAFVAPADNGSAITFFTAACVSSDGGTAGSVQDVGSPIVVNGLDNGHTYTCTVSATNGNGTGAASPASASTVPATVPESPLKPTVTRGNAQISVAFVAQGDNGSAITGFTASCTSSNGGTAGSLSGPASPLVVTGLTNGKSYTCTVFATNAEGNSPPSLASTTAVPATVPDAPAQPTLTHGASSISVAFVPSPNNGGAVVSGFTASCTSSNGGTFGSNTGTVSPILVSTLSNGKSYTCTVHATNAIGDSAESLASAATVPAAVPTAPAQPTVSRGNTQISVTFVAPANNGSPITGYTASCTSSDGGVFGSQSGGVSPIVVSSLTNGKTYTCTVLATNGEGDSAPSIASAAAVPATLPGTPAQPTVTHGNASISVAFVAPSDGGSAITGYTASCTSSDGGTAGSNTGGSSPIVVSALTNGNTYTCTVFATNGNGSGLTSAASASTVPATVPGAPAQPTLTHGNASISVAFVAPVSNGGSLISGYTATCTSSDGGAAGNNSGASSPIVVSALDNGKTYTCVVHATNAEGDGANSVASASTIPATVPSAPVAPTLTHGNAQISVAFVVPADGGSAITGYTATCTSSDGGTANFNTGASSPIVVSSLTNGKTYTCVVHATNAEGDGPDSVSSASTVPATLPGTPAQPTVTPGDTLISVAFVAPGNGGSAILSFTASCTSSNGGTAGSSPGGSSPVIVTGLTNGKTYTCVVHATNAEGDGPNSVASASTIPASVPATPAAPTVTHGDAQISVAFVAPANGGSPITAYTASCNSSNGGASGVNSGASSPIVVGSLGNGFTYTCTVHATNSAGDSLESPASATAVPATIPSVPNAPTVTRGNGSISVAFVAPANGGSAITGYTASCTSSDGGTAGSNTGASSPIVVSGLTNGNTYTCTVHATNAEGSSIDSSASSAAVPATVPTAPAKPTVIAVATQISVSFVAPANGGTAITGYTASCSSSDGGVSGSNTGSSSPIQVLALSRGNTYTCTVHATNAVGDSSESVASNPTVVPATVPDTPAQPTNTFGNGQISVAFVAPNNGGSAITGYSANCTSSDGGTPGSHSSGVSPIVVTGLTNGKTYTCTVLATNLVGDSSPSAPSAATVPATVPGAPAAPTLTSGNASLSVAFLAPVDNGGSAVTGDTVSCTSSDGGTAGSNSGASSPIVVIGLTNGKTYTCAVSATNVAGSGAASVASASAVPTTVPSAPAAPTLTHGNAQISVAIVAPANGGSAITGYTAICTSSDGGVTNSNSNATSPVVVTGLTNGKTYTCTALATNAAGDGAPSVASTSTVPATVPNAPAAPTVIRGNSAISVAFVAPANGGSAITGYTASCTSGDGGTAGSNTGSASPIVVSALTNGNTYTCTVHATNPEGASTESMASSAVVPTTVPFAPATPTATAGAASISVAFVAPGDGGSAITGYTVSCTSSDGGASGTMSGAVSPIVVPGLTKTKTYTCNVSATNSTGNGLVSPSSAATLVPATVPDTMATPTVTHGDSSISVAFVAPNNGGSAITQYTAACTSSGGGTAGSNTGASSPIVVSLLTNTKTYTCTVHAHNSVGDSVESPASASAMPNVVPGVSAKPTVAYVSPRRIRVTFSAPVDLGTPITAYGATCTSSNGGLMSDNTGTASPIMVGALTNGKTYTCVVHSRNSEGPGAASAASAAVLVASAPVNTVAPSISGSAKVGRTLTAHKGTWTAAPAPVFHYQWTRCTSRGTACVNISGRTSGNYRVTTADAGHRIRLVVRATNIAGTTVKGSSVTLVVS